MQRLFVIYLTKTYITGDIIMDVLERILELRKDRDWTEYQLAEKSGLTQSTISSWYRKNINPTIPSLEKICDAFGITMSQFFLEDATTVDLTPIQLELIKSASNLDAQQLKRLVHFLNSL